VLVDDSVRCWGYSHCGQAGGASPVTLPTTIANLTDARSVTMGMSYTCAQKHDDTAWCWGCNEYGQLGAGHYLDLSLPHLVYGHGDFESFSASSRHVCALKRDRTAWCWGYNSQGQLGAAVPVDGELPVRTLGLAGASQVTAGEGHSCALMSGTGAVHCWGRNDRGQLGDGTLFWSAQLSQALGLTGATNVAAGTGHTCAVNDIGEVYCWGDNATYQLGDGTQTTRLLPTKALGALPADALQVSAGESHSCAVTSAGEAYCWGWNKHGEVGRGSAGSQSVPIQVAGLPGLAQQISAGHFFTCALVDDGGSKDVYCWGLGDHGQLGNGSTAGLLAPGAAVTLSGDAATISAGYYFACASLTNGQVECWGYNAYTQLGNLSSVDSSVPVPVLIEPGVPLTGIKKVTTGLRHACAMTLAPGGQVRCWGDYRDGQLGLAPGDPACSPMHGITGATDLTAGFHHTCMLVANGVVWCTGSNAWGQLGDGTMASTHSPVQVPE
jgi:alpha-tubulin suppressor-like RCC1 family protein